MDTALNLAALIAFFALIVCWLVLPASAGTPQTAAPEAESARTRLIGAHSPEA